MPNVGPLRLSWIHLVTLRSLPMSEAELWELILISQGNMGSVLAVFLSLVSAYLIVAYLVGKTLTKVQYLTVNILFSVAGLTSAIVGYAFLSRAAFLLQFTDPKYRAPASAFIPFTPYITSALFILGILAALKFMSDVRESRE